MTMCWVVRSCGCRSTMPNDDFKAKATYWHRRAQQAEGALERGRAKYRRLCLEIQKPDNIGALRPLLEALSVALNVAGVRTRRGTRESWHPDANEQNAAMQILDSIRSLNWQLYHRRRNLLNKAQVNDAQ